MASTADEDLAEFLREALLDSCADRFSGALVSADVDNHGVVIDGYFDLVEVARRVRQKLST